MRAAKYIAPAFIAFTLVPALFESASAASDPTGVWMNDTGRGAVEIKKCGEALCGNVVWVKSAADASGCGKPVIGDVKSVGGGRWDNGWIFSPEKGRKYDVELTPLSNGNLKVMGYAGMKFLSKTMIWKPAPADLQLCGQTAAKTDTKPVAAVDKKPIETASITPPSAPAANSAPSVAAKATTPAPAAETANKSEKAETPAVSTNEKSSEAADPSKDDSTASDDDSKGNDIASALGKLKIGDMSLDKVLTRTKSGKCKLDLPWFKVTLNCEER